MFNNTSGVCTHGSLTFTGINNDLILKPDETEPEVEVWGIVANEEPEFFVFDTVRNEKHSVTSSWYEISCFQFGYMASGVDQCMVDKLDIYFHYDSDKFTRMEQAGIDLVKPFTSPITFEVLVFFDVRNIKSCLLYPPDYIV